MKNVWGIFFRFLHRTLLLLFVLSLFFILLYKYLPVYYTPYMFFRNLRQARSGDPIRLHHDWKPLSEISPELIRAVIASEDYLFLIHNGFDAEKTHLTLHRGARALYVDNTTLSQQTARNVFLIPGKSFILECLETYFTVLLEFTWGKERILEVYLNSVEMNCAIFGAEAMAQEIFGLPATEINAAQAAMTAACLINPCQLNPNEPTTYLLRRQAKIRGIMDGLPPLPFPHQ
jgi:monofunctional biosynthetic peptidoglycan transglycosylase